MLMVVGFTNQKVTLLLTIVFIRFSMDSFRVFDIHILQREDAKQCHTQQQITRAGNQFRLGSYLIYIDNSILQGFN